MKRLNAAILIWFICLIGLLIFVFVPGKGADPINPIEAYEDFLPGKSMNVLIDDGRCDTLFTMSYSVGSHIVCTPAIDDDTLIKRIYVFGWDNQVQSVQFYFQSNRVVLGDLVTWYDRWQSRTRIRSGFFLRWEKKNATASGGWHGMVTKITALSFTY